MDPRKLGGATLVVGTSLQSYTVQERGVCITRQTPRRSPRLLAIDFPQNSFPSRWGRLGTNVPLARRGVWRQLASLATTAS